MSFRLKMEQLEGRDTPTAFGIYAVATGPISFPRLQVYDFTTGGLLGDFRAYEANFTGGVNVAIGDVNNDGFPEVITGPGPGGGPRVRVFDGRAFRTTTGFPQAPRNNTLASSNIILADFFAFEVGQTGGTYVTSGNITGGANAEVIVGAGPGGGPRVRIFDGGAIATKGRLFNGNQVGDVAADFFAFESNFRNGVLVSLAPSLATTYSTSLAVCPGLGGAPRIRVLDTNQIRAQGNRYTATRAGDVVADFFDGSSNLRGGAYVSSADFNSDGIPDVAVGTGEGVVGAVTIYNGFNIFNQRQAFRGTGAGDVLTRFNVSNTSYTHGVTVGATLDSFPTNRGLLLYGFGGGAQSLVNQSVLNRFSTISGGLSRQVLKTIVIDPNYRERPNVSN